MHTDESQPNEIGKSTSRASTAIGGKQQRSNGKGRGTPSADNGAGGDQNPNSHLNDKQEKRTMDKDTDQKATNENEKGTERANDVDKGGADLNQDSAPKNGKRAQTPKREDKDDGRIDHIDSAINKREISAISLIFNRISFSNIRDISRSVYITIRNNTKPGKWELSGSRFTNRVVEDRPHGKIEAARFLSIMRQGKKALEEQKDNSCIYPPGSVNTVALDKELDVFGSTWQGKKQEGVEPFSFKLESIGLATIRHYFVSSHEKCSMGDNDGIQMVECSVSRFLVAGKMKIGKVDSFFTFYTDVHIDPMTGKRMLMDEKCLPDIRTSILDGLAKIGEVTIPLRNGGNPGPRVTDKTHLAIIGDLKTMVERIARVSSILSFMTPVHFSFTSDTTKNGKKTHLNSFGNHPLFFAIRQQLHFSSKNEKGYKDDEQQSKKRRKRSKKSVDDTTSTPETNGKQEADAANDTATTPETNGKQEADAVATSPKTGGKKRGRRSAVAKTTSTPETNGKQEADAANDTATTPETDGAPEQGDKEQ